jgi:RNA polymerase sigma factor (sigma-70 family)
MKVGGYLRAMSFPDTRWSILAVATLHGDENSRRALDELCQRYWQPVYAVVKSRESSQEVARDLTQAFFLNLMEKSTLRRADRGRGRFRTFLLTVLWRFLRDERKKENTEKRGGQLQSCELDEIEGELAADMNPVAEILDHEWALVTLERALATVRKEIVEMRGEAAWEVLCGFLPGSVDPPPMAVVAQALGIGEGGARTEVHRLRLRCREALRRELMSTVSSPAELDAEIEYLGRILRGAVAQGA